jgi:hypothetical protein
MESRAGNQNVRGGLVTRNAENNQNPGLTTSDVHLMSAVLLLSDRESVAREHISFKNKINTGREE